MSRRRGVAWAASVLLAAGLVVCAVAAVDDAACYRQATVTEYAEGVTAADVCGARSRDTWRRGLLVGAALAVPLAAAPLLSRRSLRARARDLT